MKNDSNNAAKQMIARYPDLKPYPKSAAENLRRELRAVFPQIHSRFVINLFPEVMR